MDWSAILSNTAQGLLSPATMAFALAALGLAMHFGFAGLLNFGIAGFMAIGAYGYAISILSFGFSWWQGVLVSLVASVLFALVLGIPTLRLRGDYLAIVTIAAAEILRLLFLTNAFVDVTGSADGLSGYHNSFRAANPFPVGNYGFGPWTYNNVEFWVLVLGLITLTICVSLLLLLMKSPWGRVIKGIREDEDAVRSLGKNVFVLKMQALAIGGVLGSLAGVIYILPRAVQPGNYATTLTFFIWTILLLGGAATILGPALGAMTFWVILSLTQGILFGLVDSGLVDFMSVTQVGQIRFMLVGLLLMLLVIYRPQGFLGNKKEMSFGV
jgi:branched-chain amino acid transport system permease protein